MLTKADMTGIEKQPWRTRGADGIPTPTTIMNTSTETFRTQESTAVDGGCTQRFEPYITHEHIAGA